MRDEFFRVQRAMANYCSACSWAAIDNLDILDGFSDLLEENRVDEEHWVEQIAQAFEDAGGGVLSNLALSVAVMHNQPAEFAAVLFDENFTMEQVAQAWDAFVTYNDQTSVTKFVEKYSFELAILNDVPFQVQNYAGKHSLEYTLGHRDNEYGPGPLLDRRLKTAYQRMGFSPGDMTFEEFETDLRDVRKVLIRAENENNGNVQLLGLGSHDGAMTAGISTGDLDAASNVGVFVSGMNSDVRGLSDTFDELSEIQAGDKDAAMVTWIGYNSPGYGTVSFQGRADAGAKRLAPFLENVQVQNGQPDRFVVMGHSYGTNVVAEARDRITWASIDILRNDTG